MLSLKVVRRGLRTELCKVVGASEKDSNHSFIFLSAELFGREGGGGQILSQSIHCLIHSEKKGTIFRFFAFKLCVKPFFIVIPKTRGQQPLDDEQF